MAKARKLNLYDLKNKFGVGYDSNNKEFYFDLEDYNLIKNFTWHVSKNSVETKIQNNKGLLLHRLIMGCYKNLNYDRNLIQNKGLGIDHINHNICDNRKINLRFATKIQNGQNRRSAKGWRYEPKKKRYSARIVVNKKQMHLGYFDNSQLARDAYLKARQKYFKKFAPEVQQ